MKFAKRQDEKKINRFSWAKNQIERDPLFLLIVEYLPLNYSTNLIYLKECLTSFSAGWDFWTLVLLKYFTVPVSKSGWHKVPSYVPCCLLYQNFVLPLIPSY